MQPKDKPEVEFRCAGPIYLENGNSAISYDIGTKFGLQVENGIPQRVDVVTWQTGSKRQSYLK